MLWGIALLMLSAAGFGYWGFRIETGPGPADAQAACFMPYCLGLLCAIVAVLWWVIAVTIKAFS